jgi:cytochrome c oxidase cbb3-type subunit 3
MNFQVNRGAADPSPLWVMAVLFCVLVSVSQPDAYSQNAASRNTIAKPSSASASQGRKMFESVCAGCHGLDGRGGERGPDISTRQQAVQLSNSEILKILREGRAAAGMPPFETLGDFKLKVLLEYIRTLQGKGVSATLPGDPGKGKSLFFGGARCSECHMIRGEGGFIGRDLSTYGATFSPADVHSNILRPSTAANKANKTAVLTMRDSRKFTGVIRNEDNFSIQLQSFNGTFHFFDRSDIDQVEFLPEPIMPSDYASTLKAAQLDDLASYLVTVARAGEAGNRSESDDEN